MIFFVMGKFYRLKKDKFINISDDSDYSYYSTIYIINALFCFQE